jgi:hypothetical protein
MDKKRSVSKILLERPDKKWALVKPGHRWEDNIKVYFKMI